MFGRNENGFYSFFFTPRTPGLQNGAGCWSLGSRPAATTLVAYLKSHPDVPTATPGQSLWPWPQSPPSLGKALKPMHCHPLTSSQPLPALPAPSHTHTHTHTHTHPPFSPSFQGSLAENYHISCVITQASWAFHWLAGHPQPEMSTATQLGTDSPAATPDLSPGGSVTRWRPPTGSLSLFSLVCLRPSPPCWSPYTPLGEGTSRRCGSSLSSQARNWTASNCREEGSHWNSCSSQQEDVSIRF